MNASLAKKIKALKKGDMFTVAGETERRQANRDYHTLRRAGVVNFALATRKTNDGKILIIAI